MLSALESLAALPACKRPLVSASVLVAIFVASRLFKFVKGLRAVSNLPGLRVPFEPILPPGAILPITWWNPSNLFTWNWRKTLYQRNDTFSVVPFLMGLPAIYTSNMDVFRQVLTGENSRTVWHKWDVTFSVLEKWGPNVLSLYGGEPWRRHRRAVGPAFNNDLHQEVWNETLITYRQMVEDEGWSNQNVIEIPGIQTYTTKLALLVMSKCGFGLQYDWSSPPTDPDGNMSIQESLRLLADTFMLDFVFPSWVLNHFPSFAQRREAFRALTGFLKQRIALRIDEVRSGSQATDERTDIFTLIVRANVQDSGKVVLDEEEVIGNVFALLFAGHETTARTMSAVLSLLALHQDIQEEMVEHIISVIGYDREPDYEDYEKLNKVLSLFFESLRLFPTTYLTLRISGKDSVLDIPNPIGEEGSTRIAVEENTLIILDMIGLHRNQRYFENPEEFKPSRWYDTHNESETFPAFGTGPRACLGRKFAILEAVAFLTVLLRDWHMEPVLQPGESAEMWGEKVHSQPTLGITMTVRDAPVRLTRRRPCN